MPTELPPWLENLPPSLERLLEYARVDFAPRHRQPSAMAVVAATVVSIAGSLAADALLVMLGKKLFPATAHYSHFQFSDYSKLTVAGVLIACIAWPIVTRISSSPRWLFFRQAIAVTLVLLLPDLYIWYKGQPVQGVCVLMVMHLAIALVTYNALVHIAKAGEPETGRYDEAGQYDDSYSYQPRRSRHAGARDVNPWDEGGWDTAYPPSASRQNDQNDQDDQDDYEHYYRDSRNAARRDMRPVPSGIRQDYQSYQEPYREPWDAGRRDMRPAPSGTRQDYQDYQGYQGYQDSQQSWEYGARDSRREYRGSREPRRDARPTRSHRRDENDPWT